jgi:conjugative relaxase-like TrwC/TraI family protein
MVVLSMARVGRGRQGYYLDTVGTGREHDGGLIEADGLWVGSGAGVLGLSGKVAAADLDSLLAGIHPATGQLMNPNQAQVTVAGIDCTFSAPKSVSLLHALGPAGAVHEVMLAHESAVTNTLSYLEEHAGRVRRAPDGGISIRVEGLTAAAFVHRTSRAPDPHLHTHVIVANCGRGTDGRWSALDGRALFAQCGTASVLYEAQLRLEVGDRLGIRFHADGRRYDIEGFDASLLRAFSQRSAEIEQHLAEKGFTGPRARRIAALATRPPKDLTVPYDELVAGWRERSISLGIPVGNLGRLVDAGRDRLARHRSSRAVEHPFDRIASEILGPQGLTMRQSSFSRDDLVKALCRNLPDGAAVKEVAGLVGGLVESGSIVARANSLRWLQARDGGWFPAGIYRERFTTPEILALEERIAAFAMSGKTQDGVGVADSDAVARALAARPHLHGPERETVAEIVQSRRGVEVLATLDRPDWAGSVLRTDVLEAARAAWMDSGMRLVGVAPDRRTAQRFEAATAIESVPANVIPWGSGRLADVVHSRHGGVGTRVMVVTAADRIGARRLAELCDTARHTGTKVLLVPDHQLDRADSRPLQLIADQGCAIRLDTSESMERLKEATQAAIDVQPLVWSEVGQVRIGLARSAAEARSHAWRTYLDKLTAGQDTYLVCADRAITACLEGELRPALSNDERSSSRARVIAPQELPELLDPQKPATLVVLGEAIALPSSVRRQSAFERTHIVIDRGRDPAARREQVLEAALSPSTVRAVGAPRRDIDGRAQWRSRAREHQEGRDLSRDRGLVGRDIAR